MTVTTDPRKTGIIVTTQSYANAISVIGDSRVKNLFLDSTTTARVRSVQHPLVWADAMLGRRIDVAYNGGVSGNRADQYLSASVNWRGTTAANLTASINANALWWLMFGAVNDISAGYTAAQIWDGYNGVIGWDAAINAALAAGKKVILWTEPGATGFAAGAISEVNKHNQRIIQKAKASPGVYVFDYASVLWDPTVSTGAIAFRSGYSGDGTHLTSLGAYKVGVELAAFLSPLVPPRQTRLAGGSMTKAQGGVNWISNPLFGVSTGGTINTGISGTAPSGVSVTRTGSATATSSVVSATRGNGHRLACTFTASGETVKAAISLGNAGISAGDVFQALSKIEVAASSSNMISAQLKLEYNYNGYAANLETEDLYGSTSLGAGPTDALTLDAMTEPAVCPAFTTLDDLHVDLIITAYGAGSATVTWSEVQAIKQI